MKRLYVVILCFVLMTAFTLCGCSLFNGINKKTEPPKIDLTIFNNEQVNTIQVELGKIVSITPVTKEGYYLKGYFDQPQNGIKYIDTNGTSLTEWSNNNPTQLYTQWGNIFELEFKESPDYVLEFGLQGGDDYVSVELEDEIINAIHGNPTIQAQVCATFKAKGSFNGYKANFWISDQSNKVNGEQIARLDERLTTSYTEYTLLSTVDARVFKRGKIFLYANHGDFFGMGYAKEITITFNFVNILNNTATYS